ncbi:MAG TPA: S53 family peptidase [Acidobacteriaceae bacterium]|jgi:subtilase family serine protease|nr:S53 family peptidase [Acidobacteriaceae bacterium]
MTFRSFPRCGAAAALLLCVATAFAQAPNRLLGEIDPHSTFALPGSVNPRLAAASDLGRLDPATAIAGITVVFQPTPDRKAALDALVAAQQTPGSSSYHAWITPAEYASFFGLSDADLAQVESWLESQGFNVDGVSGSRTSLTFSGTAAQVEAAFGTQMHRFALHGSQNTSEHFANATPLAIPAALQGVVTAVRHLDDFRPHSQVRFHPAPAPTPAFTSSQSGGHFLTPKDVATIYNINPAYNSGYNGNGQTIVVVGQSAVVTTDITNFQSAAGLTTKAPTITLVPGTGASAVSPGDEAESDLDLEYAGATAPGATIDFVYVGSSQNYSVFDALEYAVDNKIGSIINISYGTCETDLSSSDYSALDAVLEQAASQGQSVIAASGDDGSTSCFGIKGTSLTQQEALAVNYPASSAYATSLGGTEFLAADVASSTYWESASGSDVISSALSYIPEQAWNDDNAAAGAEYALSSGGGGVSVLAHRPSWQTGVTGVSSGSFRLVPDVSLDSSAQSVGYLYCTSDTSGWSNGQKASCNSGFRDSSSQNLTVAGGTSFAAPIFSGMLAMVDQKENSSQGVAASNLYALAANSTTYASAFHDITSGSNACTAGSSYCSGSALTDYAATTGYDEATGLGSVDFNNLLTAWSSGGSSSGTSTGGGGTSSGTFAVSATGITTTPGVSGTSTVSVLSQNNYAGTVAFTLSGTSSMLASNACYTINNLAVAAGATATTTLTIYTSQATCTAASGARSFAHIGAATTAEIPPPGSTSGSAPWTAAAAAGFLLFAVRRFRSKVPLVLSCLLLVSVAGLSTGCGNNSTPAATTANSTNSASSTQLATGSYALTLTAADTANSALTASTTVTLTVN